MTKNRWLTGGLVLLGFAAMAALLTSCSSQGSREDRELVGMKELSARQIDDLIKSHSGEVVVVEYWRNF